MAGIYYTWDCNRVYPRFLLNVFDGNIDISRASTIECYWVSNAYIPLSSEDIWLDVVANIGNANDYYGPFVQGTPGSSLEIDTTITYETQLQINTMDNDDNAGYWGTACYRMDIASVFQGAEVPTLAGATGTNLKTLVFTILGTDDATRYLLGTISQDYDDGSANTIEVIPNGSPITVNWFDPVTYAGQVAPEPGILFKFDDCECDKEDPSPG